MIIEADRQTDLDWGHDSTSDPIDQHDRDKYNLHLTSVHLSSNNIMSDCRSTLINLDMSCLFTKVVHCKITNEMIFVSGRTYGINCSKIKMVILNI